RAAGEREGKRESPALSAGQPTRLPAGKADQPEPLEELVPARRTWEMRTDEVDDLPHAQCEREAVFLRADTDRRTRGGAARVVAEQLCPPAVRTPQAEQDRKRRR